MEPRRLCLCNTLISRQLGLHDAPILKLWTSSHWDPLLDLVTHAVRGDFADVSLLDMLDGVPDAPTCFEISS